MSLKESNHLELASTGRDEARAYRKQLNARIEATVPRLLELSKELSEQIKACSLSENSVTPETEEANAEVHEENSGGETK